MQGTRFELGFTGKITGFSPGKLADKEPCSQRDLNRTLIKNTKFDFYCASSTN